MSGGSTFVFDNNSSSGDNVVHATTTYVDNYSTACRASGLSSQSFQIISNGAIVAADIDWSQYQTINQTCISNLPNALLNGAELQKYNEDLATYITSDSTQNPNNAPKDQVLAAVTTVSTSVINSYTATCLAAAEAGQAVYVRANGNVTLKGFNWSQLQNVNLTCIMNDENVVNASAKLTALTGQSSSVKLEWWGIFLIVFAILIVIIISVVLGVKYARK